MLNIPVLRWGKPYESLETDEVKHFVTGETIARVGQANACIVGRDMRRAQQARDALRQFSPEELISRVEKAGELYLNGTLPVGDGQQSPDDFARSQSASTGLPEHMCRANMQKNHFVLSNMQTILDALTRGLDLSILSRGYGVEERGVVVSYQAQSPVPRPSAALQLTGRPHALAAGDPDASRVGPQARPTRTVDSVSHGGRVLRGGDSAGGLAYRITLANSASDAKAPTSTWVGLYSRERSCRGRNVASAYLHCARSNSTTA